MRSFDRLGMVLYAKRFICILSFNVFTNITYSPDGPAGEGHWLVLYKMVVYKTAVLSESCENSSHWSAILPAAVLQSIDNLMSLKNKFNHFETKNNSLPSSYQRVIDHTDACSKCNIQHTHLFSPCPSLPERENDYYLQFFLSLTSLSLATKSHWKRFDEEPFFSFRYFFTVSSILFLRK